MTASQVLHINDAAVFKFRMRDADGEVVLEGRSTVRDVFDPLDDFGRSYGLVEIQYWNGAKWDTL